MILINSFLTDNSWLQVHKDSTWDMLACTSLTEEGIEGVIATTNCFVAGHLAIRLNSMFQAVQLPAGVTNLHTGLAYVN